MFFFIYFFQTAHFVQQIKNIWFMFTCLCRKCVNY